MPSRSKDRRIRHPRIEWSLRITKRGAVYLTLMVLITVSMWVFLPDYSNYGL